MIGDVITATDWWARESASLANRRPRMASAVKRCVAAPTAICVALAALVGGVQQWQHQDGIPQFLATAADRLLSGHPWNVFADPQLQVGPFYLMLLAPIRWLPEHLHLNVWFVAGAAQSAIVTWLAIDVLRRFASPNRVRVGTRWLVGLSVALGGILAETAIVGHFEELIASLLLMLAAAEVAHGRYVKAGLLLGLGAGTKLWCVFGIATFANRDTKRFLRGVTVTGAVAMMGYLPFLLLGHVGSFSLRWPISAQSPYGLMTGLQGQFAWQARAVQALLVLLFGVTLVWLGTPTRLVPAGLIAMRLLIDPQQFGYYWSALWLVVVLGVAAGAVQGSQRSLVVVAALTPVVSTLPYLLRADAAGATQLGGLTIVIVAVLGSAVRVREFAGDMAIDLRRRPTGPLPLCDDARAVVEVAR